MTNPQLEASWYLRSGDRFLGSFSASQLLDLQKNGRLRPHYEISSDQTIWQPVTALQNLILGDDPSQTAGETVDIPPALRIEPPLASSPRWYYEMEGQQHGPISQTALMDLIAAGRLTRDNLVWNSSLTDWQPLHDLPAFQEILLPLAEFLPLAETHPFARRMAKPSRRHTLLSDAILDFLRELLPESVLRVAAQSLLVSGQYALQLLALLAASLGCLEAWKVNSPSGFLVSLLLFVGLTLVRIIGLQTAQSAHQLVDASPSRLSSLAYPRACSLLILTLSLAVTTILLVTAANTPGDAALLYLLAGGTLILGVSFAAVAQNEAWLRIELASDVTLGEEGLGILAMAMKLLVRVSSSCYGIGALGGLIGYVAGVSMEQFGRSSAVRSEGIFLQTASLGIAFLAALSPFLFYAHATIGYILIDVLRALLQLPTRESFNSSRERQAERA